MATTTQNQAYAPCSGSFKTVAIETLGCKLNQADSDSLARQFHGAGLQIIESPEAADLYILNTCTVTHVADRKARQLLRRVRRANPKALIVATGCYAQRAPQELSSMPEVDLVVGNLDKHRLLALLGIESLKDPEHLLLMGDPSPLDTASVSPAISPRTRAMVKIQEGCDQVCAFCIVPKVRGREYSIPPEAIVEEVRARADEGFREVVLTGTQLGSYGRDHPGWPDMEGLIRQILKETRIERLRVSSLQPQDVTPGLIELWQERRFCRHLHMPLQSGSDAVLKRMRRRYSTHQYATVANALREAYPQMSITADIIVSFPAETAEEFEECYRFCQSMELAGMHVFPFSPRLGTTAYRLAGHVADTIKRERVQRMLGLAQEASRGFRRRFLGQTMEVLWENATVDGGVPLWPGLTDNYIRVYVQSYQALINRLEDTVMVSEAKDGLWGELVDASAPIPF